MVTAADPGLSELVKQQLRELLADPMERASLMGGVPFTSGDRDKLEALDAQVGGMMQDFSLGSVLNNPTWISGISVVNSTITADKLVVNTLEAITTSTGDLNVTGDFIAATSFPATGARVVINSSGLWGYSGAATTTFKLNVDGSGEIGTGANKIVWTTGGAVTVPVATIGSLTIAEVGGGVLGGTYQTATTGAHINISSAGIEAYNATSESGSTRTFRLQASTGAMSATGNFTIQSAATGAHITIDNAGGIAGYRATTESAGNRTFLINATDGSGHLGLSTGTSISWDSSGNVSVPGSLLVNGTVTAGKLSVTSLSAISANLGTITAGSITGGTITADTITTGTLSAARVSGGSLGGDFNLGTSDIVVNSTGKVFFGSGGGDYLGNDLLHFTVSSTESARIEAKYSGWSSGQGYGAIAFASSSTAGATYLNAFSGTAGRHHQTTMSASNTAVGLTVGSTYSSSHAAYYFQTAQSSGSGHQFDVGPAGNTALFLQEPNLQALFGGRIYPGSGSGTQTSRYISDNGSNILITTNTLHITGNSGQPGLRFDNISNGGSASPWSSSALNGEAYFVINLGGVLFRVPFFSNS